MAITFCDFNYDSAYEFTLSWGGEHLSGDHWDLHHDKVWYMGCFIRYNGVWTLTGNSMDKIHPALKEDMIQRIIACEALNPSKYETYRNARTHTL